MKIRFLLIVFLIIIISAFLYAQIDEPLDEPSESTGEISEEQINKQIESIFTRGLNYYIQREYKKAAMEWKKVLDIDPTHERSREYMEKAFSKYNMMEVSFYQGLDLFNAEQYEEAIPYFKQVLMINPRHEKALYYLELCYKFLEPEEEEAEEIIEEADRLVKEEEFTKAIALYKIAILLQPDNQEAQMKLIEAQRKERIAMQNLELMLHLQAGREYHNKKKYVEAIQEWSKALLIDPDNEEANKMLAIDKDLLRKQRLQQKLNEMIAKGIEQYDNQFYLDSKATFQKVIKMDPGNNTAEEYLRKIADMLEKMKQAKLRENEAEKHFMLGVDYFNKKQYEKALDEFDFTLNIIPTHQGAIDYKKRTLEILKKLELEKQRKRNELIQRLLMEGIQLYQMSEFENAIYNFKKVLQLDPENQYALEYLKLSEEALRLQRQSKINEDSPYYPIIKNLEIQGKKNIKQKKYSLALHFFSEIKDLFPLNKEANKYILQIKMQTDPEEVRRILDKNFARGKQYYNKKNYQRALYEFDLIKSIDPAYPEINKYYKLAKNPPSLYGKQIESHFNKGLYYFAQKQYESAIKEWRKTIELDKNPLTNKYLAKSLANISKAQFRLDAAQGKITYARTTKVSAEKQQKINKHYYMGVAHYTEGNYEKALQEFRAVLKLDPNHTLALKNIEKVKRRMQASQ